MANVDDLVKRLQRLDVCAVSDAMDKLGLPPSVSGLTQQSTQKRIAGQVVTYKLVPAAQAPAHEGAPRHLGTTAIEAAQPGNVIVIEQRTGLDAGSWGGILSLAAKLREVAGVVVDGPVRDIDEARAYDFPVYARGLTARTARSRVAEAFTNQPVRIGEVTVCPGDFVIADASGAVFIAAADIERVLQAAEMIVGREAAMAQALRDGQPVSQVMGAAYEHMLK
jgi:regulator of RNase E activity RraA